MMVLKLKVFRGVDGVCLIIFTLTPKKNRGKYFLKHFFVHLHQILIHH